MAKYDPNKQYKWNEEDEFILTGNQFGLMLNQVRSFLAKPESQEVMIAMKVEKEMAALLAAGVESGVVIEIEPEVGKEMKAPVRAVKQKPAGNEPLAKKPKRKPNLVKK
jgi:hypothetical protein